MASALVPSFSWLCLTYSILKGLVRLPVCLSVCSSVDLSTYFSVCSSVCLGFVIFAFVPCITWLYLTYNILTACSVCQCVCQCVRQWICRGLSQRVLQCVLFLWSSSLCSRPSNYLTYSILTSLVRLPLCLSVCSAVALSMSLSVNVFVSASSLCDICSHAPLQPALLHLTFLTGRFVCLCVRR